jgi:hypothetical protein
MAEMPAGDRWWSHTVTSGGSLGGGGFRVSFGVVKEIVAGVRLSSRLTVISLPHARAYAPSPHIMQSGFQHEVYTRRCSFSLFNDYWFGRSPDGRTSRCRSYRWGNNCQDGAEKSVPTMS